MEYDKISNLLGSQSENFSKFVTREYVRVNCLSNTYYETKSIRFKTPMLRSDLCDYADAYILINGKIIVTGNNSRYRQNRLLILKNNEPLVSCITKINGELIEDAEDLDIVIPMYNLLEYSKNYRKTIGSFYNYYRDELSDNDNDPNFINTKVVNLSAFTYKNKIVGNTNNVDLTIAAATDANCNARGPNPDYNPILSGRRIVKLAIPLKYLGNFWIALYMPLISCEVSLELK